MASSEMSEARGDEYALDSDAVRISSYEDVVRLMEGSVQAPNNKAGRQAKRSLAVVMTIALGGVFVDAYDFTSLGIGVIQLKSQFALSALQVGWLSAAMAVSTVFGAMFGGYFVDKLGRRPMFLIDLYLFVVSAVGAAFAPSLWVLVFFRLMMGLGVGLDFPVALSFVAELARRSRRGRSVNVSYINWYVAAIVGFGASYIGLKLGAGHNLWRIAVGLGAVPAAVILVLRYLYLQESPLWAARHGDLNAAAQVIKRVRGLPVLAERDPQGQGAGEGVGSTSVRAFRMSFSRTARILFSPPYRRRSILVAVIGIAQSIEYYAVIFYLPVISQLLFGASLVRAILGGMLFSVVGLTAAVLQALVCDRTGIRPLAAIGAVLALSGLAGMSALHSTGVVAVEAVMVSVFIFGHALGPGPQVMAYGTLSYPTAIRASGVGWTQGILRVGSVVGFVLFPVAMHLLGFTRTFGMLAVAPATILVALWVVKWEPVGVDIEAEGLNLLGPPGASPETSDIAAPFATAIEA